MASDRMRPETTLAGDNPSARGAWAGRVEGGGKAQGRNVEGHGDPDVAGRHPSNNEGKERETEGGDGRGERDSGDGMTMRRRRWVVEDEEEGNQGGGGEGGGLETDGDEHQCAKDDGDDDERRMRRAAWELSVEKRLAMIEERLGMHIPKSSSFLNTRIT